MEVVIMATEKETNGKKGSTTFVLKIEGASPILMNPMTDDLLEELRTGVHAPKDKESTRQQVAEKKIIRNEEGKIGIPAEYLFSCLVEAGRFVKYDSKKSISTKDSTLLPSFLTIEDFFFPFTDQDTPWKADVRRGILDSGGKKVAVPIVRPRFDKWGFEIMVTVDTKEINEDKIKDLFTRAGNAIGLADFRPSCRGPFGRFKVVSWEKMD
jgi:hypothetical protein